MYVTMGRVLSILIPLTVVLLVLEAKSKVLPIALWFFPSLLNVIGPEQEATPERASVHEKLTRTSVLFHPKVLAPGARDPVIVGAVLSSFTKVFSEFSVVPARSVAK